MLSEMGRGNHPTQGSSTVLIDIIGSQTWRAGICTIEIRDFHKKLPFIVDFPLSCLITIGYVVADYVIS